MSESTLPEKSLSPEEKKERRLKQIRDCQKRRRMLAKAQGLCGICASKPALPGYKTCQDCYARVRIWQERKKNG